MTVKEARDEINSVWPRMSMWDRKDVQDHWFWSVVVPNLKETDTIDPTDWQDILEHIKWYYTIVSVNGKPVEPEKAEA